MRVITSIDDAVAAVGSPLGVSDWLRIDQSRIDAFAAATGDHQWIHVDPQRAAAESPYGTAIAHGLLTLSLIPDLSKQCFVVDNAKMGINYGLNKVRFVAPVAAGARVRVRSELALVDQISSSTVHLTVQHTVEVEGSEKPAAVALMIGRYVF
ncbi:MaoC family dehydratase [Mycobacterium sp. CVI_P3]|uniref:MaoC family dehydratase n=1 Tax=Mycobacterium pinniadriaticum TaxID=2994102 RepID=A0ABT3SH45_9MYCO|nr:MaoC family dehydratase [Mycobacterium pinniadriaticum]MCX2932327.1 MaoC family dehydratase [Mycobacterium pinniadriaticum]MCX2938816.1 MaoC family dehydratase [Mycobacterium pinniadriaticum]